jgi:RNA 2',3'-cyclic 3'-phosphodiesterase
VRLFVAVDPGERLRADLATRLDTWRRIWDLNWVRPQHLHITLRFLGEQPADVLPGLDEALADAADRITPFRLGTGELGVFPNWQRPRVFFLQLVDDGALEALAAAVNETIDARIPGGRDDNRRFRAHLTLARIKHPLDRPDREAIRAVAAPPFQSLDVRDFRLIESRLTPQGPIYAERRVFPLATAGSA